jgi:hypothetical protein
LKFREFWLREISLATLVGTGFQITVGGFASCTGTGPLRGTDLAKLIFQPDSKIPEFTSRPFGSPDVLNLVWSPIIKLKPYT